MNLTVEASLKSWLSSLEAFDGIAIHSGQSNEEIPGDQPALIVGCESVDAIGRGLHRATAGVALTTPAHLELEQHRQLIDALRTSLLNADDLAASFAPSLTLVGAVLTNFSESVASGRWIGTAEIILGLSDAPQI
jgi:hypothetical protein